MNSTNDKLILQLENQKQGNVAYQYEIQLLQFQMDVVSNEQISFFYTFKDISIDLEEKINEKIKPKIDSGRGDGVFFCVKFLDKVLCKIPLDVVEFDDKEIEKYEMELYFIFEKVAKTIINKISEEHKNLVLSNIEKKQNG